MWRRRRRRENLRGVGRILILEFIGPFDLMVGLLFKLNVVRRERWFRYRIHRVWPQWGAQSVVRFPSSESQCWKVVTVSVGSIMEYRLLRPFDSITSSQLKRSAEFIIY